MAGPFFFSVMMLGVFDIALSYLNPYPVIGYRKRALSELQRDYFASLCEVTEIMGVGLSLTTQKTVLDLS